MHLQIRKLAQMISLTLATSSLIYVSNINNPLAKKTNKTRISDIFALKSAVKKREKMNRSAGRKDETDFEIFTRKTLSKCKMQLRIMNNKSISQKQDTF